MVSPWVKITDLKHFTPGEHITFFMWTEHFIFWSIIPSTASFLYSALAQISFLIWFSHNWQRLQLIWRLSSSCACKLKFTFYITSFYKQYVHICHFISCIQSAFFNWAIVISETIRFTEDFKWGTLPTFFPVIKLCI